MKRLLLICLTFLLAFSLVACQSDPKPIGNNNQGSNNNENKNLEGSLESILEKIYDTAKTSENFKQFMGDGLQTTEITADKTKYFLGKDGMEFDSGIASEPIMSSSAYSLCLVRAKVGADVEKIKTDIKENVDPMKWVCVGVDPKNVIVDNIGDVIILIMSNDEGKALHDAFLALKG